MLRVACFMQAFNAKYYQTINYASEHTKHRIMVGPTTIAVHTANVSVSDLFIPKTDHFSKYQKIMVWKNFNI